MPGIMRETGKRQFIEDKTPLPVIIKGTFLGLFVSLAILFFSSLILNYTALPEASVTYLAFVASLVGILTGSYFVGKRVNSRGWLNGGLCGTLFVIVLLIMGFIFLQDVTFGLRTLTKPFLGFAFGAVGGMIGVNL